jgi:hypothetical protein
MTAQVAAPSAARTDERLVALREDVLHDAEHAVGNLLQRLHHAARGARAESATTGERLQAALGDLERVLELLFDYVTPVELELRPTDAARVSESLAAQVRGHGATVTVAVAPVARVLADGRQLSRCFQLISLASAWEAGTTLAIATRHDTAGERVEFAVTSAGTPPAAPPHAALAVAVATRLVELHGGSLARAADGSVSIVLPVAG